MKLIIESLSKQRCILFAGSGVCRDAGLPNWKDLAQRTVDALIAKELITPDDKTYCTECIKNNAIPLAVDVLLSKVRRSELILEIRKILNPKTDSIVINALSKLNFKGVISTNYDKLTDKVVTDLSAWRLTNSKEDLKNIDTAMATDQQFILKIHGDIDNLHGPSEDSVINGGPFMVLSKADYSAFISNRFENLKFALHSIFSYGPVLFLGYSFDDPDISQIFAHLKQYLRFKHTSWFVGLQGDKQPDLPENIEFIAPISNWNELPSWLEKLSKEVTVKQPLCLPEDVRISEEERDALKALAEYLSGIESDDLSTKTLASVIVSELTDKKQLELKWFTGFIAGFLSIGPKWAESFAYAVIDNLSGLGVIKLENEIIHVMPQITLFHEEAQKQFTKEKNKFFRSLRKRFAEAPIHLSTTFDDKYNEALIELCMRFGESLAKWIHLKLSKDINKNDFEKIFQKYFNQEETMYAVDITEIIFENTNSEEVPYLYRLISSAEQLNSVKLKPEASRYLRKSISNYEIFLDTNILLPLIIQEHDDHSWIARIVKTSVEAGVKFFVLQDYLEEIKGHKNLAQDFLRAYSGDIEKIKYYAIAAGQTTNCFVRGYLNANTHDRISWEKYLQKYETTKVRYLIEKNNKISIETANNNIFNKEDYEIVKAGIGKEWSNRLSHHIERNPALNEHDTRQFLYIYHRRDKKTKLRESEDIWFLSYETIFEKIYQIKPQFWKKPPTFKFPAWASFIDSYLISTHDLQRKDILKAIVSSTSSIYDLPDPLSIVRRKACGGRPVSKTELSALKTAISDGSLLSKFEKAQKNLAHRKKDITVASTFADTLKEFVGEVKKEEAERIHYLSEQLKKAKELGEEKDQVIEKLQKQNDQSRKKKRRRQKK